MSENAFPWNVCLAFLAALASYTFIEKPFLALRYRPFRRSVAVETPVVAAPAPAAQAETD